MTSGLNECETSMRALTPACCLLLFAAWLCGCQTSTAPSRDPDGDLSTIEATRPANLRQHVRNNSASLLHDLLKDESNLSKLLLIKRESRELNDLVRNISGAAEQGARQLEQLAQRDRTLDLRAMALPSGEVAAREAEAKTKERELLKAKGEDFEFALLLSQAEALNYGVHLARVAAESELNAEAARPATRRRTGLPAHSVPAPSPTDSTSGSAPASLPTTPA